MKDANGKEFNEGDVVLVPMKVVKIAQDPNINLNVLLEPAREAPGGAPQHLVFHSSQVGVPKG